MFFSRYPKKYLHTGKVDPRCANFGAFWKARFSDIGEVFEVMKNNLVLKIISPDRVKICTVHSPVYMISCNDYSKMNMNFVSSEVKFSGKFVIFSYLLQLDKCLNFEGGFGKKIMKIM